MLAKIQGLFRLTRDAELRYTPSGSAILKLGLACSEKFGDRETQLFIDGVVFGKPAEIINQYAGQKGTQIFLCGKLQTESWDKDGQRQYKTSMVIEGFDFIKSSNKTNNTQNNGGYQQNNYNQSNNGQTNYQAPQHIPEVDIDSSEIPF